MTPRILKDHIVFSFPKERFAEILRIFPTLKAKNIDGQLVIAIPLSLDSAKILRNMGIESPSPIRTHYDWPIMPGRTPGWWQIDTAEFLTLHPRCFCLNKMRTRKTLSTLWAVDYLQRTGEMGKCLIVAPLSTLEIVWAEHIFYNMPHKRYAVLHGSAEKRRKLLAQEHDIYIVNHHGLEILKDELIARNDITHVVIDEIRTFFNSQTKLWKAAKAIITPNRTAWGLTGTPIPNAPTDAYGQMKLIKPENFKGSFTSFKQLTMQQFGPFKWVPRRGYENTIKQVLSPAIQFERSVVTDMEPQVIERHCELSKEQAKHLHELMKQAATEIDGRLVNAVNAAALIGKIVQVSCGAVYDSQGDVVEMDFGPRLKVIEDVIEENDEKVIVFWPFTGVLDAFARELGKKWSVAVVDGGVSATKRAEIFSRFQKEKDPHVLVAHPACMAHGLELTAASAIIFGAPHNNADQYHQACARIDGGGQKVKIDIIHVSATPQERKIYQALREKKKVQDLVCDLFKNNLCKELDKM